MQKPYSFRDKVLGGSRVPSKRVSSGLLQMKLASLDWESRDRLAPHAVFDETMLQALAAPWEDALTVKLLGKQVSYHVLHEELRNIWQICGGYKVMNAKNGNFMVKFDVEVDRGKFIAGGP